MIGCYYPTSIVAIDDDHDFLNTLDQYLHIPNCATFTSPQAAIDFINQKQSSNRIQSRLLKASSPTDDANTLTEHYALHINLRKLHEEIYFSHRFQDISVIIVDYYMEEMNGIEICQKLMTHPAKKILLTGGVDKEKVAIEAFNKGIIHRFINKSDTNFPTKLKQTISILQDAYFRDLSKTLIPYLPPESTQLLQNASYVNFTNNLFNQLHSTEYYILDTSGSILYLDEQGTPTWFIVKNKSELDDFIQIARDAEGPKEIIQSITNYQKIPFFFSDNDYQQSVNDWHGYLHDAKPLPGTSGYYYALIKGYIHNNIDKNRLASYLDFKNNKVKA